MSIIAGEYHDQFPIDTYQTGSGTSSNMNINEVLASLASAKLGAEVHPNDHVNASQSSNDVFPTSVHLAVTGALIHDLIPALDHLAVSLEAKAVLWADAVKSGRTHLIFGFIPPPLAAGGHIALCTNHQVQRSSSCVPSSTIHHHLTR